MTTGLRLSVVLRNVLGCRQFVALVALAVSAAMAPAAFAGDVLDKEVTLNIPVQPLSKALVQFAVQANIQVMLSSNSADGQTAKELKGRLRAGTALETLLHGSGLSYQAAGNTVTVAPAAALGVADHRPFRLTEDKPSSETRSAQIVNSESAIATTDSAEATEKRTVILEEVIITGSRLKHLTFDEPPAPVTVFSREQIEQLGATNIGDVFNYLPQQPFSFAESNSEGAAKSVQLHGLGGGTTLTLINGRRTITSALLSDAGNFDLTTIPLAGVERIEIVSQSSSAVYGADAVGGVVNVILKDNIESPTLEGSYGTADGGGAERRASFSVGHSSERFKGTLLLDYFNRSYLLGSHRDLTANQDYTRFGGIDFRTPYANPGNICSVDGAALPGLPTACAAVPAGSSGIGLTPGSFLPTAGQTSLSSDASSASIIPKTERVSAIATGQFQFEQADVFAELMYSHREVSSLTPYYGLYGEMVPATNAFNPFGVSVLAKDALTGLGNQVYNAKSDTYRAVLGIKGSVGRWDWELSTLGIKESAEQGFGPSVSLAAIDASLASSDPNQAFNVFQDGPGASAALLNSFLLPTLVNLYQSKALQEEAFIRGPVLELPAGNVESVIGLESRHEELNFPLQAFVGPGNTSGSRTTWATYSELEIPIVNRDWRIPLVRRLSITAAGRYDHYSDFGGSFNPQFGFTWRPFETLLLRASHGKSFRAPGLFQLHQPRYTQSVVLSDPFRNNESYGINYVTGGNSHLQPEKATSSSYGFEYTPEALLATKLGASYWSIHQDQRAEAVGISTIFANINIFPDRVVREPQTPADLAAGIPGRVISVDTSTVNAGSLRTSGVDVYFETQVDSPAGKFRPSLLATWVNQFETADFPSTPIVERVGVADYLGSIPRWRATATLPWNLGAFGAGATVRYVNPVRDSQQYSTAPNGRTIPSQTLVDLQASFTLNQGTGAQSSFFAGTVVRVGVINVFNKLPAFAEADGSSGYDISQGDLRGRFGYVSLSKGF